MMPGKVQTIEQLGETGLLLPDLIDRALAANDRLKYYLTLLQTADAHARQPGANLTNLRAEREASGIDEAGFDDVVAASRLEDDGLVRIPDARAIRDRLIDDLRQMLGPVSVAADGDPVLRGRLDVYRRQVDACIARLPSWDGDRVSSSDLDRVMRTASDPESSLHQLVMSLHRELNQLQATVANDVIDGAKVYRLADEDRELVRAFMKGVNSTAGLKFDHTGLGTTATRQGDRLSIQNDLGTTSAHILVVHVAGLSATILHTDIHRRRVRFFQQLLEPRGVVWERATAAMGADFQFTIGRFTAADWPSLQQYLTFLGSRLVFLIDWNRARKRLARFVKRSDAVAILQWAADHDIGHRAFVQAGDMRLVYTALERVAHAETRYGTRLDDLIGRDGAKIFLMSVLRIATDGLKAGHSLRLIQDQVEAELLTHLQSAERSPLVAASDHAMLISALAEHVRQTLVRPAGSLADEARRTALLAKAWETRADDLVRRASHMRDELDNGRSLTRLLGEADQAADALEESAFLLTLIPNRTDRTSLSALADLADVASEAVSAYIRCLEYAREIRVTSPSEVDAFLVAVDRLMDLEHQADESERATKARLIEGSEDFRSLHVLSEIGRGFEQAVDAVARCGLILRDYVLHAAAGHR